MAKERFVYPFTHGYLGCFHFGALRNNVAVRTVGSESFCGRVFSSLRYICTRGIAGSCDT